MPKFNSSQIGSKVLDKLQQTPEVYNFILAYAKGDEITYRPVSNIHEVKNTVTHLGLLSDSLLSGLWIACKDPHHEALIELIQEYSEQRPLNCFRTQRMNLTVYDLL